MGGIRVAAQGVRCIPAAAGPRARGTLPGPRGLARALPDQRRWGPREDGQEDRWEDREPLRRRRRGLREAQRRRSRGRAGRFVSTAHSRPYVTMATASAGAGREPEPLRHQGPGPRQPRDPRPSSQQLGSVEETRTPPPNTGSHCQCRHSRVSESLARDRKAPESPKSRARSYCSAGSALLSHSGQSKALRSPSPAHLFYEALPSKPKFT